MSFRLKGEIALEARQRLAIPFVDSRVRFLLRRNDKQYVLEYKNQLPPALAGGFYLNSKKALAKLY